MSNTRMIEDAILGNNVMRQFTSNPNKFCCYLCGNVIKPDYILLKGQVTMVFAQRDNRPICIRCYKNVGYIDRMITRCFQLFFRMKKNK